MMTSLRIAGVLPVLLFLSSCALFQLSREWPEQAPAREVFEQHYQMDQANQALQKQRDYLLWVSRFYRGMDPVPGWLEMTRRVSERVPAPQRTEVQDRLYELGIAIGSEWARDNSVRRIDNRIANAWRDALLEALAQDDVLNFLDRVEQDAAELLAGRLDPDEIYFERYYIDEFDF